MKISIVIFCCLLLVASASAGPIHFAKNTLKSKHFWLGVGIGAAATAAIYYAADRGECRNYAVARGEDEANCVRRSDLIPKLKFTHGGSK